MATLPKPDDYQVTSGEEDEKVQFEERCRTHRYGTVPTAGDDADHHTKQHEKVLSVPPSASHTMLQQNASNSGDDGAAAATAPETTATDTATATVAQNGR